MSKDVQRLGEQGDGLAASPGVRSPDRPPEAVEGYRDVGIGGRAGSAPQLDPTVQIVVQASSQVDALPHAEVVLAVRLVITAEADSFESSKSSTL